MWTTNIRQPIARKNTGGGDMITIKAEKIAD
jgi:hypothetical protein